MQTLRMGRGVLALGAALVGPVAGAQEGPVGETRVGPAPMETVTIIGHRPALEDVPGSVHVVNPDEIRALLQSDVTRVLRNVPGVYLQEEDGFGLRPNIGIRGSGLDRSARIALQEDGVLIAPAPYAAPAAYYFPTQRRMHAVEVLKGPAAIAVGPRTTGGAINLRSTPIPEDWAVDVDVRAGQHEIRDAHLSMGDRGRRLGWLVETVQAASDGFKRIDAPAGETSGPTGFDIEDYVVKLELDNDPSQALYRSLRLKLGRTDQVSDETYLGLTDSDFALDPNRRYAASAGDRFTSRHEQFQLGYLIESDGGWSAEITAYRNDFARDWFKVESVLGSSISGILQDPATYATELAYLRGATSPDDAITKRHNNREYYAQGVQAAVTWERPVGAMDLAVTTGLRLHEDEEDRFQRNAGFRMEDLILVQTSEGAPGSQANRVSRAQARALFVDTQVSVGAWILTPGVRVERMDMERLDFSTADPDRSEGPTRVRDNSVSVVIPGLGALYLLNERWRLLGGVHKGFNPPAPGTTADEESSLNLEFGARYSTDTLSFESIFFFNDYDNLVGTVTESTGGSAAIGDQYDGGAVTVQGLELSLSSRRVSLLGGRLDLPMSLKYTWTAEAAFDSAFESEFEPWGDVEVGDELPYIPEHQLRGMLGVQASQWSMNLAASYVSDMRAVAGQGAYLPAETIDSYVVWDALGNWQLSDTLSTYVKVDNLFDATYVAARRPAGLRPGLGRTAYLGLTYRLR